MIGKARKLLTAVIAILFVMSFIGCSISGSKDETYFAGEAGKNYFWYEIHRLEDEKYFIFVAVEDGIYGYYYDNGILREMYSPKGGERPEWSLSFPEQTMGRR